MRLSRCILTLAAAVLASHVAFAGLVFEEADKNGDGAVDADEFAAAGVDQAFKQLDANGDGKLDSNEYSGDLDDDEDC